ncbi:hypothetical protein [Pseudomonas savastanoi]|uniref:hypothetical protein n=1 Tax=Pseudomonas savastanoi TaxID=29438 RepID=UPI000E32B540|nr:hypothetical protein [Pseudomonas savastanoi]
MKTIAGLIFGMLAGWFVAVGIIVYTTLIGVGGEKLGFTQYTLWYYILCLCLCISLLIGSSPVRKQMKLMSLFVIALIMVLAIGFLSLPDFSSGGDQLAKMQATMLGMAMLLAKGFMYVVPGALSAFYAFLAYEGLAHARAQNQLN